ncbi:PDR/VanB family oxidoreductase [Sodalis sp. dw_96]|uniref:PDR/VanB family oxidoreductase n=1 Tax=Sodalis sp. dw_96 TaxID=2719794 RepID=UPI001BD520E5|nr:PDR/VanB family oxidoreductase [Sodalis sp. dw_96]
MSGQPEFFNVVVAERKDRGTGVIVITLVRPDGGPLPPFAAGAHIPVQLPGGLLRYYSLCGDPARRTRYKLAVLVTRHTQGGGQVIRERLLPGVQLSIGEPRNHFPLEPRTGPTLLLAGGIGVTPLLLMALALKRQGRPYLLHYFGRGDTLAALAEEPDYGEIVDDILVDTQNRLPRRDTDAASVSGQPRPPMPAESITEDTAAPVPGESGPHAPAEPIPEDAAAMASHGSGAPLDGILSDWQRRYRRFELYYCGSTEFMQTIRDRCVALGIPEEDCHCESFAPPKVTGEKAFEVKIFATGEIITVSANQTIADALNDAGVNVEISCGQGLCGTCLAGVKDGIPDHRDEYLSADEKAANNKILLCCSRALSSTLVIDL